MADGVALGASSLSGSGGLGLIVFVAVIVHKGESCESFEAWLTLRRTDRAGFDDDASDARLDQAANPGQVVTFFAVGACWSGGDVHDRQGSRRGSRTGTGRRGGSHWLVDGRRSPLLREYPSHSKIYRLTKTTGRIIPLRRDRHFPALRLGRTRHTSACPSGQTRSSRGTGVWAKDEVGLVDGGDGGAVGA
jgi:hypothetical protein